MKLRFLTIPTYLIRKEKWDGSKGQELMSTVSSSINQDTKDYLNEAKSKIFNPAYLRSPSVFFGIGEER